MAKCVNAQPLPPSHSSSKIDAEHLKLPYHFKTRLSEKKVTAQHSRLPCLLRFTRPRSRTPTAKEKFDNDGFALVLGMPDHHEDDYVELEYQLTDRIQIVIDKEIFQASERRVRYGNRESKMSLNGSTLFPICSRSRTGSCFRMNGNWLKASLSSVPEL